MRHSFILHHLPRFVELRESRRHPRSNAAPFFTSSPDSRQQEKATGYKHVSMFAGNEKAVESAGAGEMWKPVYRAGGSEVESESMVEKCEYGARSLVVDVGDRYVGW